MKFETETLTESKRLEEKIKFIESDMANNKYSQYTMFDLMSVTNKFLSITKPKQYYPNTNTNQLIK